MASIPPPPPPKELPNFEAMAQSFEAIARECRLIYNLPGFGNLPGSKDPKDSMSPNAPPKSPVDTPKVDTATIKACLDHIDGRIELMERRILTDNAAREVNNIIRLENLYRREGGNELIPLHSVITNTEIGGFPKNVDDFSNLPSETVMEILRELNDPFAGRMHGDADQKRRRLAMLAGVRKSDGQ